MLTFPFSWRRRLAQDGALLGNLTRIFAGTAHVLYAERAAREGALDAKTGAVTVVQRVGLHFAIECQDTVREAERPVAQGARLAGESLRNAHRNEKLIIGDPWGACIELIARRDRLRVQREPTSPMMLSNGSIVRAGRPGPRSGRTRSC